MARIDEAAIDLPDEYYAPIGKFMFRYAQLEYLMAELTWRGIDIDNKQGRTLMIGMTGMALRATLGTVASTDRWVKSSRRKAEINYITGRAKHFVRLRNQLAHGSWQHPKGDKGAVAMHFMKESAQRLLPRRVEIPPREIWREAESLKAVLSRLKELIADIERERPPMGSRQPV